MQSLTAQSYTVRSTIRRAAARHRGGVAGRACAIRAEHRPGRVSTAPRLNLGDAITRHSAQSTRAQRRDRVKPSWHIALQVARLPLYDVHWTPAVVVEQARATGRSDPRRPERRPHPAAVGAGAATPRAAQASTTSSTSKSSKASKQQRRASAELRIAPARCRARRWCWRTRPAASWRWPAASPIR